MGRYLWDLRRGVWFPSWYLPCYTPFMGSLAGLAPAERQTPPAARGGYRQSAIRDRRRRDDAGTLLVVPRSKGPVVHGKWRDSEGVQRKPALGVGWIVLEGDSRGSRRPNAQRIGGWVERRGTPDAGSITVRGAWDALRNAQAEHEENLERDRRQRVEEAQQGLTVARAAEAWLEWGRRDDPDQDHDAWKHATAKNNVSYAGRVVRELGDLRLDEVTEERLRRFLAELKPERNGRSIGEEASKRMRATYVLVLRGIFTHAVRLGWILSNPAAALKIGRTKARVGATLRREQYFEPQDVRRVVRQAREAWRYGGNANRDCEMQQAQQDATMILMAALTGLRIGELIALTWQHVDLQNAAVHVVEARTMGVTGTPKSGAGRTVPLAPEIAEALAQLRRRQHFTGPQDLAFVGRNGGHVDSGAVRRRFQAATERAELHRISWHGLRHTFGVTMARHGTPLALIQSWLGHGDVSTTMIYAAFVPTEADAALVTAAFGAAPPQAGEDT